jgi:hypothetical protein
MTRIRWEGEQGFVGKIAVCDIKQETTLRYDGYASYTLSFYLHYDMIGHYTKIYSAKRGAERLVRTFFRRLQDEGEKG